MVTIEQLTCDNNTCNALLNAAREVNSNDASQNWSDVWSDLNELFCGADPNRVANAVHYGDYDPTADYWKLDVYGNIESLKQSDLMSEAWDNAEDILESLYADADQYESSIRDIEALADYPDANEE